MFLIPVMIIIFILVAVFFAFWMVNINLKVGKSVKRNQNISKETQLKNALKKIEKNPRDPYSLFVIAEHHREKGEWQKAFNNYETLAENPDTKGEIDTALINHYASICATNMQLYDVAYRYSVVAHSMAPSNSEISYQIGNVEFQRKNYDRAVQFLQQAYSLNGESAPVMRLLGHTYFKLKKNKEALTYIRKAIDLQPNDKESLFTLAQCYSEAGQKEQAMRIYTHLRPDPIWGAEACLKSGLFKVETHQEAEGMNDFKIGLHHKNMKPETNIELRYQIGTLHLALQEIGEGLKYLYEVQSLSPGYKETDILVDKYKELNSNKNLQIFMMASSSDFVALCRKITLGYFPKAKVKITKTQVHGNEWVDIAAEIDTPKWSDVVMFRFIRTQGVIGELVVRDFHAHLKDVKAGKGICVGIGRFSDEAKHFTEARLIDLIDKERFSPILNNLDATLSENSA
ncbi:MAG: tetratricopeptide repeat protein [Termitinemataceae bacterium]|nr:MAG: tetratricopeptide repeat protein [Termitinemataceae bacterium]